MALLRYKERRDHNWKKKKIKKYFFIQQNILNSSWRNTSLFYHQTHHFNLFPVYDKMWYSSKPKPIKSRIGDYSCSMKLTHNIKVELHNDLVVKLGKYCPKFCIIIKQWVEYHIKKSLKKGVFPNIIKLVLMVGLRADNPITLKNRMKEIVENYNIQSKKNKKKVRGCSNPVGLKVNERLTKIFVMWIHSLIRGFFIRIGVQNCDKNDLNYNKFIKCLETKTRYFEKRQYCKNIEHFNQMVNKTPRIKIINPYSFL